jgi:hypothetical protein
MRELERDFGLDPLSLVMYCPPGRMNTKIADVKILVDDGVYTLDNYEESAGLDSGLTGGHLAAQKKRFRRLWRIYFACDPDVYRKLKQSGLLATLRRAVTCAVLGQGDSGNSREETMHSVAQQLAAHEGTPLYDKRLVPVDAVAARGRRGDLYPSGLPTFRELAVD